MATLTIEIGGNGAGKTTWCRQHRDELPEKFYNADSIAEGLGGWNSRTGQQDARRLVDERIREHLTKREDFGFESTYSGKSRPHVVIEAKRLGYETRAILIATETPAINVERVAARVAAGTGHYVPRNEIHRRWTASKENLVRTASAIDIVDLVDNSGAKGRLIARIDRERATTPAEPTPEWARKTINQIMTARSPGGLDQTVGVRDANKPGERYPNGGKNNDGAVQKGGGPKVAVPPPRPPTPLTRPPRAGGRDKASGRSTR